MYSPGDIISHTEICLFEGFTVQQGMNYHTGRDGVSVLLMNIASNAPYDDAVQDEGRTIIYEGHDVRRDLVDGASKDYDQPLTLPSGALTANGKFFQSAQSGKHEQVRIYEKIRAGIWTYSGTFTLEDAWMQDVGHRQVLKLKLTIVPEQGSVGDEMERRHDGLVQTRMIPSKVKFEVFKRDQGKCVICGSQDNLHYDHELPYSRGGTSLMVENIRLLCAKHNLQKSNKIE